MRTRVNRVLTAIFGLLAIGVGGALEVLVFLSLAGGADQQLPLAVSVLVIAMSLAMLFSGGSVLTFYAHEAHFDNHGIEMRFMFRKERVLREAIQWHRKLFFRNAISGGSSVGVLIKYTAHDGTVARFRMALLSVIGSGPAVAMTLSEIETPFDTWEASRQNRNVDKASM